MKSIKVPKWLAWVGALLSLIGLVLAYLLTRKLIQAQAVSEVSRRYYPDDRTKLEDVYCEILRDHATEVEEARVKLENATQEEIRQKFHEVFS